MTKPYKLVNHELHYKNCNSGINLLNERNAIVEYLSSRWNIKTHKDTSIQEAVDFLLIQGVEYGINHREIELEKIVGQSKVDLKDDSFKRAFPNMQLYFENAIKTIMKPLKEKFLTTANPKNYARYKKERETKDAPEEPDYSDFKGEIPHLSYRVCAPIFPQGVYIEQIHYEDVDQGRSSIFTLAGAIFRQGASAGYTATEKRYGTDIELLTEHSNKLFERLRKQQEKLKN